MLLAGCGEREDANQNAAANAKNAAKIDQNDTQNRPTPKQTAKVFAPGRDQFGVEKFNIVYELKGQTTGTRTLYVEDYGRRVGSEEQSSSYGQPLNNAYYYDGERGHLRDAPDAEVFSSRLRMQATEPTSFAVTPATDLGLVGYVRVGDKTILGKKCEHWKNETMNFEGCRWKHIELEFFNGAGTDKIIQTTVAVDLVEGEGIPKHLKALAN